MARSRAGSSLIRPPTAEGRGWGAWASDQRRLSYPRSGRGSSVRGPVPGRTIPERPATTEPGGTDDTVTVLRRCRRPRPGPVGRPGVHPGEEGHRLAAGDARTNPAEPGRGRGNRRGRPEEG